MLKSGNDKIIVGYDLGDVNSQLSYCFLYGDRTIETISAAAGSEVYDIPTVLCKRVGVNQWFYGKEALAFHEAHERDSILIDHLLRLALAGEEICIDEQLYDPVGLLTLFTKKCMAEISRVTGMDRVLALMITTEQLTADLIDVLGKVVRGISLKYTRVYFQSYAESYYYFSLYQQKDIQGRDSMLLYCDGKHVRGMHLCFNHRTTPVVAHVDEEELPVRFPLEDEDFLRHLGIFCGKRMIVSVYLIGAQFGQDWMEQSLKFLCRGRRVFQGTNLFSKGACYSLLEKHFGSETGEAFVFLGEDKLKANIGMKVKRRGEESYLALLDAGGNWYEAENTIELYVERDGFVDFVITPLIAGKVTVMRMELAGLFPQEQQKVMETIGGCNLRRISLHLYMTSEKSLTAQVTDLGFGQLYPSTGMSWQDELILE